MKAPLFILVAAAACSSTPAKSHDREGGDHEALVDADGDVTEGDAGTDASKPDVVPLCDQAQHLRLWVLVEPQLGRELAGSQVRVENGVPFLSIDGTCSYWINGGWAEDALSRDRGIRTGTLTTAQVATIEQTLPLGDVGPLGDCISVAGQFDVATRTIATEAATARCPSTGMRFDAAWSVLKTLAQALWDSGTPMDGALHVSAVDAPYDSSTSPAAYTWPIAMPLSSFILDPGKDGINLMNAGVSHLVSDADAAKSLRALRDQYLLDRSAQPGLYSGWDGLKTTDSVDVALVYMRDAVPYEDASGLLHF